MSVLKPRRYYRLGDRHYTQVSGPPLLTEEEYAAHQYANRRAIERLDQSLEEVMHHLNHQLKDGSFTTIVEIGMKLKEIIEDCEDVRQIVVDDSTCFNLYPGKGYESPEIILCPARNEQLVIAMVVMVPIILLFILFTSPYAMFWRIF
ncbi:hypothetical protein F4813DRAFT_391810 [Daldinia decipiens]|uniref:uncharacterized protein n=1 Tax=Daldinia decipiens TaxID=326647 RepID=UPI0020C1FF08|nr:uncharacterized protein F4813DRAFT_391810 [Daldinia decipiens]KAI1655386.1 hypothetical protein F4813DRAFT_391810 [Daldinia decipiens]